jgi:hypothetical protein
MDTMILVANISIIVSSIAIFIISLLISYAVLEYRAMNKNYQKERLKIIEYIKNKIEFDGKSKGISIERTLTDISKALKNNTIH